MAIVRKLFMELCYDSINEFDKIFIVQIKQNNPINHAKIRKYFSTYGIIEEILQLPKFLIKAHVTCVWFEDNEIWKKIISEKN